ncbi:uncharacterized protein LOC121516700 [Cheilinus undulatus]|uniref:uncharacterized protein LOC121516700 n=1 Tax=Cheilinus undulatus TaxID=241271 RepID=UPI001BD2126D|nr:uncharacterized protein LOC121516700 [Cheilinus undulatus]
MDAVLRLLLLLLGASHGLETFCDGRQDRAQCYGALGGTVIIKLMDDASQIYKYQWLNKTAVILNARRSRVVHNLIGKRSSFTPTDGTFRINDLRSTEEGEYTFEIFDSHGYKLLHQTLQLTIQAPVSSVMLVFKCLPQGQMRVSCSSQEGDSPQYSWTLDGSTLKDSQLLSGSHQTNNITLKEDVSGRLVCSVRNHVSRISACGPIYINCTLPDGTLIPHWAVRSKDNTCVEPAITPDWINTEDLYLHQCDVITTMVILFLIGIAICFVWKRNKVKKAKGFAVREIMENENPFALMAETTSSGSKLPYLLDFDSWPL